MRGQEDRAWREHMGQNELRCFISQAWQHNGSLTMSLLPACLASIESRDTLKWKISLCYWPWTEGEKTDRFLLSAGWLCLCALRRWWWIRLKWDSVIKMCCVPRMATHCVGLQMVDHNGYLWTLMLKNNSTIEWKQNNYTCISGSKKKNMCLLCFLLPEPTGLNWNWSQPCNMHTVPLIKQCWHARPTLSPDH